MNEEATMEVAESDLVNEEPVEIPMILTISLAIPVFAVLVFIFMRLFGRSTPPPTA